MCKCARNRVLLHTSQQIQDLIDQNARYKAALTLIRDIAQVSEGVAFYEMLANKGLGED